jgi:hypothetical protein
MQPSGWGKSSEGPSMLVIRMIGGQGNSEKREISPVFFPDSRDSGPIFLPVIGSQQENELKMTNSRFSESNRGTGDAFRTY